MSDLTAIYLTVNRMPRRWREFHLPHLLKAVKGLPMVVVSAEGMDLDRRDTEYLIQQEPFSAWNVYVQLLRAAKVAATKYVAVAEDDTLYTKRHFSEFRPKDDEVAYDMSRWSVFSWQEEPYFSAIRRRGNFTMIGPRELVIEALEEREAKYPNGFPDPGEIGRPTAERRMHVTRRKLVEWYCTRPIVNLCHPQGLSPTYLGPTGFERKPGELKAWDIPEWGKAADIAEIYNQGVEEEG